MTQKVFIEIEGVDPSDLTKFGKFLGQNARNRISAAMKEQKFSASQYAPAAAVRGLLNHIQRHNKVLIHNQQNLVIPPDLSHDGERNQYADKQLQIMESVVLLGELNLLVLQYYNKIKIKLEE